MESNKSFLPGYVIGGSVFMIILPILFYLGAQKIAPYLGILVLGTPVVLFPLGLSLLIIGLLFSFWSIIVQRNIGKGGPLEGHNVSVSPKTQKLNTTGPYRYTRNPMLFGTCTFYFSLALFLNSLAFLLLAFIFTVFMITFVKNTEEKRLLEDFGKEYASYRKATSLFIPLPPK